MIRAVAYFGTYDPEYPRNAVIIRGLRERGVTVYELRAAFPGLSAAEMATATGAARIGAALIGAHVSLLKKLRGRQRVEALIVGYPGHFVVPLGRVVASRLATQLVFDPLVSLYDTFAGDRGLVGSRSWKARVARAVDGAAYLLPDVVLADTQAHAEYFRDVLGVPARRLAVVPVGGLPVAAASGEARALGDEEPLAVFQYGKWSPLHGADTVLAAADRLRDEPFRFILAGEGQLSSALRQEISSRRLLNVTWLGALTPAELRAENLAADVCLGVFGSSDKADRVVPNKVFDALRCGRPLVTADTAGVRELLDEDALVRVPVASPAALADALRAIRDERERLRLGRRALALYEREFTPPAVAGRLLAALDRR